jgi:hypothetical protein
MVGRFAFQLLDLHALISTPIIKNLRWMSEAFFIA